MLERRPFQRLLPESGKRDSSNAVPTVPASPILKKQVQSRGGAMARVACVFGGTGGIGACVAKRFLLGGCAVAVFSRRADSVAATVAQLQPFAGQHAPVKGMCCDVREEDSVREVVGWTEQNVGPIRYLVNCSGVVVDKLLLQTTEADMRRLLDTNLMGAIFCSKAALKHMLRRREGSIVNIGSVVGDRGNVGQVVYSASKAALVGFTRSLAKEVASRNITVNLLVPGFIATQMTTPEHLERVGPNIPLGRAGSADEVAEVVHFLAGASYMTGQAVSVDGGLQLNF
ncbi:hypothetical protein HPB47_028321 [Ixodes persulcatus]|uniref:Uncharacterized protein n=1 Tax=Ixodes persulcatus TaxID=34615 RepID=A0AC60PTK7_IXOPE|nr:hypothetical protein HPB47_028321 [Ixodes persulcatus]